MDNVIEFHGSGSYVFSNYVRHIADTMSTRSRVPLKVTYRTCCGDRMKNNPMIPLHT